MRVIHYIALILVIIGALNWGLVGFFGIDVISGIFSQTVARIIFALVGLAGLWSFWFFKVLGCADEGCHTRHDRTRK